MDDSYFTIRWKRLLLSLLIVLGVCFTWLAVLHHQRDKLTNRLLATARQLADQSDASTARVAYLDYLELNPDDAEARLELIKHVQNTDRADNKRDAFVVSQSTKAIRSGASSPELRLILIDAAMRLEWFSTVSQWLPTVSELRGQHPRLIAYSGACLMKKGQLDEAEAQFRTALLNDSACLPAWSGLLELTRIRDGAESAIVVAKNWAEATSNPTAFLNQARLLANRGRPAEAGTLYQTAALPDKHDVELVRDVARFFVHDLPVQAEVQAGVLQRIYEMAAAAFQQPSYDDLVCMADIAHRLGETKLAQRHYQQCLEIRPGDLFATGRQVEIFNSLGLTEQASNALSNISDSSSDKVLKTTLAAKLMAQNSEYERAIIALQSVVKLHSHPAVKQDCYVVLVECLWQQQRFAEAAVRAEELLDLSPTSNNARRFCIEALIRSSRYDDAVKGIRGFTSSPEDEINAVWRLMAHAEENQQQEQLSKAVDDAALMNREATVPVLYAAFQAADSGQTSSGIKLLGRTMVEYPTRAVFRVAVEAIQDRVSKRIETAGVSNLSELTDSFDQRVFLNKMLKTDSGEVAQQMEQLLKAAPEDSTVVDLFSKLLADCHDELDARRKILTRVYPSLAKVVAVQGSNVIPVIAEILAVNDLEKQAFELLTSAMQSAEDTTLVATFSDLMQAANVESVFHVTKVAEGLSGGSLRLPETVKTLLLAECDLLENRLEAASDRFQSLVGTGSVSDSVLLMVMMHVDRLESVSLATVAPDAILRGKYPDNAHVLLASSRWNRSQGLYSVAATLARDSFLIDRSPETLVEMAYSEWLGNSTDRASHLIALAVELQLEMNELQPLHQEMIQQMQADSRMELNLVSDDAVRSEPQLLGL